MKANYFGILTKIGEAKQANAMALGMALKITDMEVGDGGGSTPVPDPNQQKLIGPKRRAPLNQLSVDSKNPNYLVAEQILPENTGGYWIREIGLYDESGDLVGVANCPPTYKPELAEGSGRTQILRMVLMVQSADGFALKIDPSVVLATREYVDQGLLKQRNEQNDALATHKNSADHDKRYLKTEQLGVSQGVAPLDENSRVPRLNLPPIAAQDVDGLADAINETVAGTISNLQAQLAQRATIDAANHLQNQINAKGDVDNWLQNQINKRVEVDESLQNQLNSKPNWDKIENLEWQISNKANAGAEIPWNSGIQEFGQIDVNHSGNIADCPHPWVMVGIRNTAYQFVIIRGVKLRNQ